MEEIIYYNELFDYYGALLTDKQRETFQDYFFDNLNIEEIARNHGISKNAVSKTIKSIKIALTEYEENIHFKKYVDSIKSEFKNDKAILKKIEEYDSIILD